MSFLSTTAFNRYSVVQPIRRRLKAIKTNLEIITGLEDKRSEYYKRTSEAVSSGHPDKLCDAISDAILDYFLKHDPMSRVACEVMAADMKIMIGGEITSKHKHTIEDIQNIVKRKLDEIGYNRGEYTYDKIDLMVELNNQSREIAAGVDAEKVEDLGAGDQGIMFGYATNETENKMPLPLDLAQLLIRELEITRKEAIKIVNGAEDKEKIDPKIKKFAELMPDAKSQVTVKYDKNGKVVGVTDIILSSQHTTDISLEELRELLADFILTTIPDKFLPNKDEINIEVDNDTTSEAIIPSIKQKIGKSLRLLLNTAGTFVSGGPVADAGLTGRKVIVDTYGGAAPHGGGAFSGKDPTKVDRSAAYAARWIAKHLVSAGLADRCTVEIAYAIGKKEPVAVRINTHGTGRYHEDVLAKGVVDTFNLSLGGIIVDLDLRDDIYEETSVGGHFGRTSEKGFTWEEVTKTDELLKNVIAAHKNRKATAINNLLCFKAA